MTRPFSDVKQPAAPAPSLAGEGGVREAEVAWGRGAEPADRPPSVSESPLDDPATAALFEQWRAEEAAVRLDDLRAEDGLVFLTFWALAGVVFLQFFTRYVLGNALGWTEEIARYLLIGVTFFGSVLAVRKGSHIAVEALLLAMSPRVRRLAGLTVDGLMVGFCAAMTWSAAQLSLRTTQFMVSIDVPKSVIYWGVCAAFAAMTLFALLRFVKRVRGTLEENHGLVLD